MGKENITSITEIVLIGLTNHRKTQILLFVIILIIYSLTLMGNLVIISLVWIDLRLHTPMYFFLANLSCLEICHITCTLPPMLANLMSQNGTISFTCCVVQMHAIGCLGGTECILLGVMAYDRYLAISHPLLYTLLMGRWRQVQLASASWAGGIIVSTTNIICGLRLPFCGPNHVNHFICELPIVLKLACADIHSTEMIVFGTSAVVILTSLAVILASYGLILFSVLKMHSTTGLRKALSTCVSHLAVVTLFYSTIIAAYVKPPSVTDPDSDKKLAVFYIVVTPLLNPIIYTLRNKDIHAAAVKVLRRRGLE
ncbi:olfactory receptor 2J2-like [Podarcis muralis]